MDSLKTSFYRISEFTSNQSIVGSQELNQCLKEFIDNMFTQIDSNQKTNRVFSFSNKFKNINSQSIATIDANSSQDINSTEEVIASSDSTPNICLESKAIRVFPLVPNIELLFKSSEEQNNDKNEAFNRFEAKIDSKQKQLFVCSQTHVVLAEDVELLKELELKRHKFNKNIDSNEEMAKRDQIRSQVIEQTIVSIQDNEEVIVSVPDIENIADDNRIDQFFNDYTLYDSVVPQIEDKIIPFIDTTDEPSSDSSEAEVPEKEEMALNSNVVYGIEPIQMPRFKRMPLKVGLNKNSLKRRQHLLKY